MNALFTTWRLLKIWKKCYNSSNVQNLKIWLCRSVIVCSFWPYSTLYAGKPGEFYYSSKNYCVDKDPDTQPGHSSAIGQKVTFVQAGTCYNNNRPCNQYTRGNRIACTVCTKDDTYIGLG